MLIRDSLAHVNAYLAERINGIEVIQLFNHETETHAEFCRRNGVFRDASIRSNIYDALMYAFVDGTGRVCIALMLWYGSSSVTSGTVTAGLLVAFIDYLDRLFRPLQQFSGKIAIIQRALAALNKIFRLLEESDQIEDSGIELEDVQGTIQFRNVSFSYNQEPSPDILRGVDLDINPGEVVKYVLKACGQTWRRFTRTYTFFPSPFGSTWEWGTLLSIPTAYRQQPTWYRLQTSSMPFRRPGSIPFETEAPTYPVVKDSYSRSPEPWLTTQWWSFSTRPLPL